VLQVDCAVGEWSGWSECDAAIGRKERTRFIVARGGGGRPRVPGAGRNGLRF
jgi:hypothetical protein